MYQIHEILRRLLFYLQEQGLVKHPFVLFATQALEETARIMRSAMPAFYIGLFFQSILKIFFNQTNFKLTNYKINMHLLFINAF